MALRNLFYNRCSLDNSSFARSIANGRYYTRDHEWIDVNGNRATIGITNYAQGALGDIVYVDLPEKGTELKKKDCVAGLESVKAASDIFTPLSGKITDVNVKLEDDSSLVNKKAESDGWIAVLDVEPGQEDSSLMDAVAYKEFVKSVAH